MPALHPTPLLFLSAVLIGLTTPLAPAQAPALSYSRDIRPILSENCFYCHGQDPNQRKAGLRLDTAEGQATVIKPNELNGSELIRRVLSGDKSEVMPPPRSNRHLTAEQKYLILRWIKEGAKFEGHWAYQRITRPPVPKIEGVNHPIDAFVRSKLAEKGLKHSPPADRATLLRRLTFDLTGLPPTPKELDDFLSDADPKAYENAVDRLLQSPRYGERMALPWLDAARYADSNGFQQDGDTFQWVWRDWVVKALNDNMPFDRFTIEQLAGDLLPNPTREQRIATAFNRNHLVNGEGGAIPEEQRFVILFDRVDVTATNWLGLTLACAQCHDHKYDPFTMKDYYSLLAAFNNVSESGLAGRQSAKKRVSPPFIEAGSPTQIERLASLEKIAADLRSALIEKQKVWESQVEEDEEYDPAIRSLVLNRDPKAKADRDARLKQHFEEKIEPALAAALKAAVKDATDYRNDELPKVMVMADDKPRDTFLLDRGEYLKPKEKVVFNTPAALPPLPPLAPRNRLGLAQWLVAPDNPLTARVQVNRLWQLVFGVGLVRTSEDFGVQSEPPTHPELLDWLASEFQIKWDIKNLVRQIVTSETYKQSSKVSPELLKADPENRYYARAPRYRWPSFFLRDLALSASGLLNPKIGGAPVYPYQPEGIWDSLAITKERDFTYPLGKGSDLYRRSLYTFWRRTVAPANMFDASSRQVCKVRPSVTNTPLHALTTLNDITWTEASRVLAEKAIKEKSEMDDRLTWIYRRILSRAPKPQEMPVLRKMVAQQLEIYKNDPGAAAKLLSRGKAPRDTQLNPAEHAAWAALVLAIFNLDESLSRQ